MASTACKPSSCQGKYPYLTFKHAKRVSKAMMRRNHGEVIEVYRCRHCSQWHLGSVLKERGNGG